MLIGKSTSTPPEKCIHPVGRLLEVVIEVLERLLRIAVLAGLQKRHCRIVGLFLFCRYLNGLTVNHHNLRFEYGKALVERFVLSPGIAFFLILRINQFFNAARQTTIQLFKIINFRRKLNLRIAVGFQISLKRLDGLSKLKNRAARIIVGKSLNTAGRR